MKEWAWQWRPTTPLEVLPPAQEEMTLEGKHCPKSTEHAVCHQLFSLNKKVILSQQVLGRIRWHASYVSSCTCQVYGIPRHLHRGKIPSWHQDILCPRGDRNQELNSWIQDKCFKSEAILHRWNRNYVTGVVLAVGIPRWEWDHRTVHSLWQNYNACGTFLQCWSSSLTPSTLTKHCNNQRGTQGKARRGWFCVCLNMQ